MNKHSSIMSEKGSRQFWTWVGVLIILMTLVLLMSVELIAKAESTDTWVYQYLPLLIKKNPPTYVLIGWNDLGMHCYDLDYQDMAVLPPYNNIYSQVVLRGDPPVVITQSITVSYSFLDNSESATKTNFWEHAKDLFDLPVPLPLNMGLAGKGMSGDMDPYNSYFAAHGTPITEFRDSAPTTPYYYQLAELVARDGSGSELDRTTFVAPISSEMRCYDCHTEPFPNFRWNILTKHDEEEHTTLMAQRPVLCADCHADPALGKPGTPDVPSLSAAMHGKHAEEGVGAGDCYACHPGPQTRCLRDVMAESPSQIWCTDCHGHLADLGDPNRDPWLDEPRCGDCHAPQYAENPGTLYRNSTGHGGLYCESCHNSTHAILPSREANDNLQSIALQGYPGPIAECTVCHLTTPSGPGPHEQ